VSGVDEVTSKEAQSARAHRMRQRADLLVQLIENDKGQVNAKGRRAILGMLRLQDTKGFQRGKRSPRSTT